MAASAVKVEANTYEQPVVAANTYEQPVVTSTNDKSANKKESDAGTYTALYDFEKTDDDEVSFKVCFMFFAIEIFTYP